MSDLDMIGPGWYQPAKLYTGGTWYIKFSVYNPNTGKTKVFRRKCNRIKSLRERRKQAKEGINRINTALATGWRPEGYAEKGLSVDIEVTLKRGIQLFLLTKDQDVEPGWHKRLKFHVKHLTDWLYKRKGISYLLVSQFTVHLATEYLDHIALDKRLANRTYNNYLNTLKGFFNWLEIRGSVHKNPFKRFKIRRIKPTTRVTEFGHHMKLVHDYLMREDQWFLGLCYLIYHGLLRPVEISRLRVKDIMLGDGIVQLHAENSKNRKLRIVTLPTEAVEHFRALKLERFPTDHYAFCGNLRPGAKPCAPNRYSTLWARMRDNRLKLDKEFKLYSLKNIGINELFKANVIPKLIQEQAGHQSLNTTSLYAQIYRPRGIEEIRRADIRFCRDNSTGTNGSTCKDEAAK